MYKIYSHIKFELRFKENNQSLKITSYFVLFVSDIDKFRTFGAGLSADMLCGLCRRLSGRRRRWQCKRKFCV